MTLIGRRRSIALLGAAFGRGGRDPGAADGPAALRAAGLAGRLADAGAAARWAADVIDPDPQAAPL
ncbi:MAG: hypothetical protein ACK4QW_14370, partial [Alphaproteobacteria bacterium]